MIDAKTVLTTLAGVDRFYAKAIKTDDPLMMKDTVCMDLMLLPPGSNHMAEGVEVGSYGVRKCGFGTWIYGTGLAEPRFSKLLAGR